MPRELAILTFQTLDGVMQAPKLADEDTSGGFTRGGWADPHWDDVMAQVERIILYLYPATSRGRSERSRVETDVCCRSMAVGN